MPPVKGKLVSMTSQHTIAVILKNKIGGLDAVLPIVMEAAMRNPGARIEFHAIHGPTYQTIKENPVLWDAVNSVGIIPDHNQYGRLRNKFTKTILLMRLTLLALLGRAQIIHFKEIAKWPLRLLYYAAPRRTFYVRDGAYGAPASLQELMRQRQDTYGTHGAGIFKPNAGTSGLQIFFHRDSLKYEGVARHAPLVVMQPPRTLPAWQAFIAARAGTDLNTELSAAGLDPNSDVIGYMVSEPYQSETHMKYGLRAANSLPALFEKTLDVLVEEANGLPILIRSQLAVDYPFIQAQIDKRPGANIIHSYLHASVIASRSRFFITNWITTTLADARSAGVPTIEYSDYNDRLKSIFANGSCCPEWTTHFINQDQEQLRTIVRRLMDGTDVPPPISFDYDNDIDVTKLLASGMAWNADQIVAQHRA
jgi:hypothetical protein